MKITNLRSFFFGILLMGMLVVLPQQSMAAGSIDNLPYFRYSNQITTPAENTFIMHRGENTEVEVLSGEYDKGALKVNEENSESSALIKHVGFYEEQDVNVLIRLRKRAGHTGGKIGIENSFLKIDIDGEIFIDYEFQNQDGEELQVQTSFNYYGINQNKYIGYNHLGTMIKYLVANDPTDISYDTWSDGEDYWAYFKNEYAKAWGDPTQALQVITKPVSKIQTVVHNSDQSTSSLMYSTKFLASPEFSRVNATSKTFDDSEEAVSLNAVQTMPNVQHGEKMLDLAVDFQLEADKNIGQYQVEDFKVTSFDGTDLSSLFSSQRLDAQHLQLTAKDVTNDQLYGTVLNYQVKLKWTGSQENPVDQSALLDNYLQQPFSVVTKINGEAKEKSSALNKMNYIGKAQLNYLDESGNALLPAKEITGLITDAFDFSDSYPEVPETFYPEKNLPADDQGIFQPQVQKVTHYYKEGEPLIFTLGQSDEPLLASRFSRETILDVTIQHDAKEAVSLSAKCGVEEQIIKDYPQGNKQEQEKLTFTVPETWLNQSVSFFVTGSTGQTSQEEIRQILLDHEPTLVLPKQFTFGPQEIPTHDQETSLQQPEKLRVQDDSQLETSRWTVKLREAAPLTMSKDCLLQQRLNFRNGKQQYQLNQEDQIVWQGTGSQELADQDYLRLLTKPTDTAGTYQGELCWTLEDAPS